MKDFINFLNEDGAAAGSPAAGGANVAAGAQNYESPIGTEQPTAGRIGTAKRKKNGLVIALPPAPNAPKIQEDFQSDQADVRGFSIPNYEHSLRMNRATHLNLADYTAMVNDLGASGISVHALDADPKSLKPSQRNFDWGKVDRMCQDTSYLMPIITSEDGYVIDGHHRWLAACLDEAPIIACRQIKMGAEAAFDWLKDKSYPRNRDKLQEGEKYVPGAGMVGGASDEYPDEYHMDKNSEWTPNKKNYRPTTYSSGPKIQHFHQVDFKDKDAAKAEGMKWDAHDKGWYHTDTSKSKDSMFPYVKSVRFDKIDMQGQKLSRTEWVRPNPDTGRDSYVYNTSDAKQEPEEVEKDEPSEEESNFQFVHHVSYVDKAGAKHEGMLWDPIQKHWYHTDPEKSQNSKYPYAKTVPNK